MTPNSRFASFAFSASVNSSRNAPASAIGAFAVLGVAFLLVVDHLLVEGEALVVQGVTHLVPLGPQVSFVVGVGDRFDRHLLADREAVALETDDLFRVVGEDADAGQPEV